MPLTRAEDDDENADNAIPSWKSTKDTNSLRVSFGTAAYPIFFSLEEMEDGKLFIDLNPEGTEREEVADYHARPMLSRMIAVFSLDRHEAAKLRALEWDVFELRDATWMAWIEQMDLTKGTDPMATLIGGCLFHLSSLWAGRYGPLGFRAPLRSINPNEN